MRTPWPSSSWSKPWRKSSASVRWASGSTMRTSRICAPSETRWTTSTPNSREPETFDLIGYTFSDSDLIDQALSHRSWCAEQGGLPSNERLEFLGDAVLGLVVADHTFRNHPELAEGILAKVR